LRQTISTISLAPTAEQQLRSFTIPIRKLFVKRLLALRISPRPPGATKLEGLDHLYRIREGDYRILYVIREKDLIVLVIKSASRSDRRTGF
jgi:mRNA interferase RelE/StbE